MLRSSAPARTVDTLALEACVEYAGIALACAFSSSAEFDADLIAARRAAGVYGPRRHRRQRLIVVAATVAALATVILLIV